MEELSKRMSAAKQALERLHEVTQIENLSDIERDALIQRFEFCFEIMWKCGKDYLTNIHGFDAASPKKVIRLFREIGAFDEDETIMALEMADDRNLTVHTYDENLAKLLVTRIYSYETLMNKWYNAML